MGRTGAGKAAGRGAERGWNFWRGCRLREDGSGWAMPRSRDREWGVWREPGGQKARALAVVRPKGAWELQFGPGQWPEQGNAEHSEQGAEPLPSLNCRALGGELNEL